MLLKIFCNNYCSWMNLNQRNNDHISNYLSPWFLFETEKTQIQIWEAPHFVNLSSSSDWSIKALILSCRSCFLEGYSETKSCRKERLFSWILQWKNLVKIYRWTNSLILWGRLFTFSNSSFLLKSKKIKMLTSTK